MISPTDTAYPVLPASPSASELTDAYTPYVFELHCIRTTEYLARALAISSADKIVMVWNLDRVL